MLAPAKRHPGALATVLGTFMALAALAALIALRTTPALAGQILNNPGFEAWNGTSPAGWAVISATAEQETESVVAGTALRLTGNASATLSQTVPASAGARYDAGVHVAIGSGTATARFQLEFLDADFAMVGSQPATVVQLGPGYKFASASRIAPVGTEYAVLKMGILASGAFIVYIDEASLEETPGDPPTPTPVPPTDTPTPTRVPPTPTPRPTSSGDGGGSDSTPTKQPTATRTPTAPKEPTSTKTPTPPRTPTPAKTPTPPKQPTPTKTPTPPKQPTATRTPATRAAATPTSRTGGGRSTFGGMLYNGDFEDEDGGKPAGWSKYGGTMALTSDAHSGASAASLSSGTTSTKWLFQSAAVEAGRWYEARGYGRAEGGEVFIRLSWYPGSDGGGSIIDQADSEASANSDWALLATGPVHVPPGAASVRVRLMLRPSGDSSSATFDDIELFETDAPPPPTATPSPPGVPPTAVTPPGSTPAMRATSAPASRGRSGPSSPSTRPSATPSPLPGANTLRLSEVMPLPEEPGAGHAHQWVELLNAGSKPVSTAGWRLGAGSEFDELPAVTVPAGAFVVVAGPKASLPAQAIVLRVADGAIGPGLGHPDGALRLIAPDGSEADALSYGADVSVFEPPLPAPSSGQSLGLRIFGAEPDAANWALTEHPTPGEANVFLALAEDDPQAAGQQQAAAALAPPEPHENGGWGTLEWILAAGGAFALFAPASFVVYRQKRPKGPTRGN